MAELLKNPRPESADTADAEAAAVGTLEKPAKANEAEVADESWKLWKSTGDIQVWGHDAFVYNKYATKSSKWNDIKVMTTDLKVAERSAGKKFNEGGDHYSDEDSYGFVNHDGRYLSSDTVVKISLNHLVGTKPAMLKKFLKDNRRYLASDCTEEKIKNATRSELIKMAWLAPRLLWGRIDNDPTSAAEQEAYSWHSVDWIEEEEKKDAEKAAGSKKREGGAV